MEQKIGHRFVVPDEDYAQLAIWTFLDAATALGNLSRQELDELVSAVKFARPAAPGETPDFYERPFNGRVHLSDGLCFAADLSPLALKRAAAHEAYHCSNWEAPEAAAAAFAERPMDFTFLGHGTRVIVSAAD